MGQSKALLPWMDGRTVIEQIIAQLQSADVADILVVTGHLSESVMAVVTARKANAIFNPNYAKGEMLSSLQMGLRAQSENTAAILVILGDQPRIEIPNIRRVIGAYTHDKGKIVAPIYQGQRGHPILFDRRYWDELLALPEGSAPRDVIKRHPTDLHLIEVATDSVISDIDTPEDYEYERRRTDSAL